MQQLRSNGWVQFLERVTLFCGKHVVEVFSMNGNYVPCENKQGMLVPKTKKKS
jgi:hypothetical protein